MAKLIDASSLIEAKDRYYGFDFCPGFWDWLDQELAAGRLYSIDRIKAELERGNDALAAWARARPGFFLGLDSATATSVTNIATWVTGAGFRQHAITEFLNGADPFLIAYALTHGHTVVTDEIFVPGGRKKVKIPAVCAQFGVPCHTPFDMLRDGGARLVL